MEETERNEERQVPVSRLAVVAFVSVILMVAIPVLCLFKFCPPSNLTFCPILGTLGIMFGISGVIAVERSGGKLVGRKLAASGVLVPFFAIALLYFWSSMTRDRWPMGCGPNLNGIGKAMLLYANDYNNKLPCAGGKGAQWTSSTSDWTASDLNQAFGLDPNSQGGQATVSSSLYLLIKYAECVPKMFICKDNNWDMREFSPHLYKESQGKDMQALWDFGPESWRHYSYSYHVPFGELALTTNSEAGMAVLADRNPWIAWFGGEPNAFSVFLPDIKLWNGTSKQAKYGNSPNHQRKGQNIFYLDGNVEFQRRSSADIDKDNIYTRWDGEDKIRGLPPDMTTQPVDKKDSLLVHDPPVKPKSGTR